MNIYQVIGFYFILLFFCFITKLFLLDHEVENMTDFRTNRSIRDATNDCRLTLDAAYNDNVSIIRSRLCVELICKHAISPRSANSIVDLCAAERFILISGDMLKPRKEGV